MRNDIIKGITKLSSGNLFLSGVCSVGVEVQQRIKNNTEKVIQEEKSQFNKARATYLGLFWRQMLSVKINQIGEHGMEKN